MLTFNLSDYMTYGRVDCIGQMKNFVRAVHNVKMDKLEPRVQKVNVKIFFHRRPNKVTFYRAATEVLNTCNLVVQWNLFITRSLGP